MLVIMDMEWSEAGGRIMPTQLSALRVLPGWKELARVDYLISTCTTSLILDAARVLPANGKARNAAIASGMMTFLQ